MTTERTRSGNILKNRVAVALGALVILASVAAAVRVARGARNRTTPLSTLGDRVARIAACDDAGVWLAAETRLDGKDAMARGVSAALADSRAFVLRAGVDGIASDTPLGRGSIASICAADAAVRVLIVEHLPTGPRSRVASTTDGGASWIRSDVPEDAVGLLLTTRRSGYAWSRTRVYRTQDEGTTWKAVEIGTPYGACRSMGCGRATADGTLWLPLEQGAEAEAADPSDAVLAVTPDLSASLVSPLRGDLIAAVALGDGGAVFALVRRLGKGGYRLDRLPGSDAIPTTLRSRSNYGAAGVFSRGSTLLVHEVTFDPKAHFFANPGQVAAVSMDGGRTWKTIDLTSERASTVCLSDSGFWVLTAPPKVQLIFHALARN